MTSRLTRRSFLQSIAACFVTATLPMTGDWAFADDALDALGEAQERLDRESRQLGEEADGRLHKADEETRLDYEENDRKRSVLQEEYERDDTREKTSRERNEEMRRIEEERNEKLRRGEVDLD